MEGGLIPRVKTRVRNNSGRNQISRNLSTRSNNSANGNLNGKNNRNAVVTSRSSNSFKNNNNNHARLLQYKNCRNNISASSVGVHNASNNNSQTITSSNGGGVVYDKNRHQLNNFNGNVIHNCETWVGDFTREVYTAIYPRLGHNTVHIPKEEVQALFNDLKLYPTDTQISEMLQCAIQSSRRNGASQYITFGEFCVFAKEMKNQRDKVAQIQRQHSTFDSNTNKCINDCQVFLGGSCNPTTWRADTAIPELQRNNISYYNPQVSIWVPELVAQEHDAKQAASVLLFVVDSQTRSTVGMIEVAFLVASGRCVVLVAQPYRLNQTIMGEPITQREYRDLVEGQTTLLMLVKSKGIRVHANLPTALKCVASTLNNSNLANMDAAELITSKLRKLREIFDSYSGPNGEITNYEFLKAFKDLTHREISTREFLLNDNAANKTMNFDKFCVFMAEYTDPDHCDINNITTTTNGRVTQPFQRQCSTNNNTCNIDTTHITNGYHNNTKYDVFLGGSLNSHMDWRRDFAIPILKKHGVNYYNPTVREALLNNTLLNNFEQLDNKKSGLNVNNVVNDQEILQWKQAMDNSKVLLFVITSDTRSLTSMILAAHYLGLGKNIVLFIEHLSETTTVICNETLSPQAIKDYNRGRVYLTDMAKRKQIPVFDNITEAIERVIDECQKR